MNHVFTKKNLCSFVFTIFISVSGVCQEFFFHPCSQSKCVHQCSQKKLYKCVHLVFINFVHTHTLSTSLSLLTPLKRLQIPASLVFHHPEPLVFSLNFSGRFLMTIWRSACDSGSSMSTSRTWTSAEHGRWGAPCSGPPAHRDFRVYYCVLK